MTPAMNCPVFALILLLAFFAFAASADENNCHDPATERKWNRLAL
jgi:hypothetical protein